MYCSTFRFDHTRAHTLARKQIEKIRVATRGTRGIHHAVFCKPVEENVCLCCRTCVSIYFAYEDQETPQVMIRFGLHGLVLLLLVLGSSELRINGACEKIQGWAVRPYSSICTPTGVSY